MRSSTLVACATLLFGPAAFAAPTTQPSAISPVETGTTATVDQGARPTKITHQKIVPTFDIQTNVQDTDTGTVAKANRKIIDQSNGPTSQRVSADGDSILILPLAESIGATHAWLSQAIQQDLLVDLSRTTRARIDAPRSPNHLHSMPQRRRRPGEAAGARHWWFTANIKSAETSFASAGRCLIVKTEKAAGNFSVTGEMNNLFPLEDSVINQLSCDLPPGWLTVSLPSRPIKTPQAGRGAVRPAIDCRAQVNNPPPQYYSYTSSGLRRSRVWPTPIITALLRTTGTACPIMARTSGSSAEMISTIIISDLTDGMAGTVATSNTKRFPMGSPMRALLPILAVRQAGSMAAAVVAVECMGK